MVNASKCAFGISDPTDAKIGWLPNKRSGNPAVNTWLLDLTTCWLLTWNFDAYPEQAEYNIHFL